MSRVPGSYARPRLPDTSPPFYFRRVWVGETATDEVVAFKLADRTLTVLAGVPRDELPPELANAPLVDDPIPEGLVIYGRAVVPPADREYVAAQRQRGLVFSLCHSVAAPEGEVGCHPLATVTEITAAEYEAARARGWQP